MRFGGDESASGATTWLIESGDPVSVQTGMTPADRRGRESC